ncbi:SAM-dependent DNA methyltransferase [Ruegeria arenilitoris]|uniref:SAM-dependent DNA methyltransferase n=1 Tax=Ruegeria arenilitoris TaxID=1173585 RepID=UPI00147C4EF5|nr:SAM-dependent DNA methyltransferase [Ruegeria arenilitoris]
MSERYLPSTLRRTLERVIKDARIVAEEGARDAIRRLGVAEGKAPSYLSEEEKELRRRLRAHARALGDAFDRTNDTQETKHLIEATAYAHWHRMLFARFLAERGLLRNPEYDVPVTLEDCRELAEAEGLTDPWMIAESYAAQMLPAVFRVDDPVLALEIDPVHTQKLQKLVMGLDAEVFEAEDSLGWTYQFWRAAEKDAVNASGVKIGADELPAVTQLFTEPYMVRFLLHNTLGAWWAGKVLASNPTLAETAADEDELRAACALPYYRFDMLRFVRDGDNGPWRPAAGTFPGWPKEAKQITFLDPCCGSGHFLTEALAILAALRRTEEHLSPADAVSAVLRDNLHGLEIDGRCVQIAAFAVALSAWRIGGWQALPSLKISWVGAPPPLPKRDFVSLADGDNDLEAALAELHDLFEQAPYLGTLIEPIGGDLLDSRRMARVGELMERLVEKARRAVPEIREGTIAARGMADAANALGKSYVLQVTNVPFLGRGKQASSLANYIGTYFPNSKPDLAAAMTERMSNLAGRGGTVATIYPQTLYFLSSYLKFRKQITALCDVDLAVGLGANAFETISGEVVNVALTVISRPEDARRDTYQAIDLNEVGNAELKSRHLIEGDIQSVRSQTINKSSGYRISTTPPTEGDLLSKYATYHNGLVSGDSNRFVSCFWEIAYELESPWIFHQSAPTGLGVWSSMSNIIRWGDGQLLTYIDERLEGNTSAWVRGTDIWGRRGVCVAGMSLNASLYEGTAFDNNLSVIIPKDEDLLGAIWCYCSSADYKREVRRLNQKVSVTDDSFVRVPFDHEKWNSLFQEKYNRRLDLPFTNEPTQWVFHGHPARAHDGTALHVALARVCGYKWPAELDPSSRLSQEARDWIELTRHLPTGDNDGLLGVPAVAGEKPLADRLRAYLAAAFGADWSDALERRLVAEADEALDKKAARDGSLEAWVRDRAFRQHCALFAQRPFIWHISDGLKDGFSVFVHYHRFDQANLRKLTYTLLGDWLARAKAEGNTLRFEKGRELQQKLEAILEGEKPYDIFVRWKSLAQQPLGWDPDLDDGVRQNIRPFILAGVLTHKLDKILKDKDRGKDVSSAPWYDVFKGERRNDHHTTLAEKRAAREAAANRTEASK